MKIILIAGKAGSGKTYLGEKIVEMAKKKNLRAFQTEFSKYIKLYAWEILDYDGKSQKPRKFLQDMGSFMREYDDYFFTRRMVEDFHVYEKYFDLVVISDVRLRREIEEIKKGNNIVKTVKVVNKMPNDILTEEEKNHITEKELENYDNFDYIFLNESDQSLSELAKLLLEDIL